MAQVHGGRLVSKALARHGVALADWPIDPVDPFFNVNTPEDVAIATQLASFVP